MTTDGPPLVGISCYREEVSWGVWQQVRADVLHADYADTVAGGGGVPVLLPGAAHEASVPDLDAAADAVVARLDALVIAGGADVEPARYGAAPHPRTTGCRPDRDGWELALIAAADRVSLPLLGVCRGMQLMAVAAGGSLVQHLPDVLGSVLHSPGADAFGDVVIATVPGSRVAAAVGDAVSVRCHHHQVVGRHPGFVPVATAADGSLEAMERTGRRFCVAVQWHPENARDARLFNALIAAARTNTRS
jgi:putative glutamine amidotransferase